VFFVKKNKNPSFLQPLLTALAKTSVVCCTQTISRRCPWDTSATN